MRKRRSSPPNRLPEELQDQRADRGGEHFALEIGHDMVTKLTE
jgi:hypothetical protein